MYYVISELMTRKLLVALFPKLTIYFILFYISESNGETIFIIYIYELYKVMDYIFG